ncbi:platelet glycoprotein VI-like isoform X1 [Sarcophilus harrisii]|uniref:Immunoglobulin domain-containing protein n=2 Tax=Sarcophilus harrisii TaxID=9305 RepID=A0A7N4V5Q3_SARHA|nr:platelet glycoprotein VI-like isoform X1 [Sarcophilus harrisii]
MTPILSALLSLGLCLGHRIKTQVDALPRPSLVAENGSLVLLMKSVTLICLGPWEADEYGLVKTQGLRRKKIMRVKPSGREGKFHISSVTLDQAGIYSCRYRKVFLWSEFSDPLELVVTGLYDPPSLSATPSSTVASGQNVSLQCGSELWFDMYALYKDGEQLTQGKAQPHEGRFQTTFHFSLMTSAYGGTYQCYAFLRDSPYLWSAPSDPLELKVTGTVPPSPENLLFGPAAQDYTVGNIIRLSLAGLVLVLLGLLLAEAWNGCRGCPGGAPPSSDRGEGGAGGAVKV